MYCNRPECYCRSRSLLVQRSKKSLRTQPVHLSSSASHHHSMARQSLRTQPVHLSSSASHHHSMARQSNAGVDVNSYRHHQHHQHSHFGSSAMSRSNDELREKTFLSKNTAMRNGQTDFDKNDIIFDDTGMILSGSMEALIQRLLPTRDYCPPRHYIFTLLLNLRTFISPSDLMQKIVQHCMFEQNSNSENFRKESRQRMFDNVYLLCSEWVDNVPLDFRSTPMQQRLKELLSLCAVDSNCKQRADDLVAQLCTALHRVLRYEAALRSIQKKVEAAPLQSEQPSGLITLGTSPAVIAQQLTHIELERLSMIGADEFILALAANKIDSGGKLNCEQTGNIGHYVDWFNQVTDMIAGEILRHSRKRCRVKTIEYLIDVAKECINVGNFNSLMAIVAGLSLPAVSRLKKTWTRVEKSKLEILQHQLDPSGNFTSYRATLKAAIWRSEGAKNELETIIIPFFALLLKDLLLIYTRCRRPLANGHLNYAVFSQLADNIYNFNNWKRRSCPFPKHPAVLQYLLLSPAYSEKELMLLSYDCEPAVEGVDREQYKKLKAEK
ncbi:hypothetical protein QR680_003057 [Steinernema hermaphroditum]|uniref:Ras-GEF domain-containing protein n=1 Tax=Steinernema hermaphroditum TaxID=289476 RepID=A0AA39LJD2_9BILA|nr:hypothetical protein QR680_003057 [Steinernema hermaphroditum]